MYMQYILCCCDWEKEYDDGYTNHNSLHAPLRCNEHSTASGSVYQEPVMYEMTSLVVTPPKSVLCRQEYHTLSSENVHRLFRAISKMVSGNNNDPSYFSPFFQTASHKKWMSGHANYIPKHMMYLWYRAYLHDFESALQQADISCGNDGKITLPYIDITRHACVPTEFKNFKLPDCYLQGNDELSKIQALLNDDEKLIRVLAGINISHYINTNCINDLYDVVMSAYGFDSSEHSSFHPFFYMVLCYIDKIHDSYNSYNTQNITPKSVEYWKILVPFRKLPIELLDISNLGYKYL